jgi:hypothetical protein
MVGAVSARAPSSGRAAISSVLAMREPDCTVSVWESCVIAPLASSVPLAVRAVLIDWILRPSAVSLSASGVIVTRCDAAPSRLTSLTPLSCLRFVTVRVESLEARVFASMSLVTASWITGRSLRLKVMTCGVTLEGRRVLMRSRASWTFCSEVAISVPYAKDAVTVEAEVFEVAVVESRFSMPCSALSIGVLTSVLTTSGDAPG